MGIEEPTLVTSGRLAVGGCESTADGRGVGVFAVECGLMGASVISDVILTSSLTGQPEARVVEATTLGVCGLFDCKLMSRALADRTRRVVVVERRATIPPPTSPLMDGSSLMSLNADALRQTDF